jgi:hypothetical protein
MSKTYYENAWCIPHTDKVYGSWKDGSVIYKNSKPKGFFVIQYDHKKEMFYTKPIKFQVKPGEKPMIMKSDSKTEKRRRKECGKTRKQSK